MMRPAPPASMTLNGALLATMLAASAAQVSAAGINLLQAAAPSPARSFIDLSLPPSDSDDAAAAHDGDCVAVADPQLRDASGYGRVSWTRGRLAWEWDRGREPGLIYLVCLDRDGANGNAGGSGMELFAALSWANAPAASRAATIAAGVPLPPEQTSFEIGPPPFISIASGPVLFDVPAAMPTVGDGGPARPRDPDGDPIGVLDPPVLIIDPGDLAPVPEPSTWLLLGTGIAAAWRAARKR